GVAGGWIGVLDGKEGVNPKSETVGGQADKYGVPRICFVNKMDKAGADFPRCMAMIRERLGANGVAVQLPLYSEAEHAGVIDLVKLKAMRFKDDSLGAEWEEIEIPADLKQQADEARTIMLQK